MKTAQHLWQHGSWTAVAETLVHAQLCIVFGSRYTLEQNGGALHNLRAMYPNAFVVSCSSAGNILDESLLDDTLVATVIEFAHTRVAARRYAISQTDAATLGNQIASELDAADLAGVLLFSTTGINAGQLLNGINAKLQGRVPVSGGVAGDDYRFELTLTGLNEDLSNQQIVAVAFYGSKLRIAHGSKGGWDTFGPVRTITRSEGNILYEIDGKPVLDLYKQYLGDKASELPASALLFPFTIIEAQTSEPLVRGVQNVDEQAGSLILFGDVENGMKIQLMRANFDNLISGAGDSAKETFLYDKHPPQLAILISCVARRLVLGQLTEEELSESKKVLGNQATICGFYSYSELSPLVGDNACHLHNQTMTITTFTEETV
ncbi:MAG: FIST C-terminal domain-containing protein [Bacteroidetes bacterium]|nr:FIST C-terminal domain-containing protein [Bacteroidota bacterium]